MPKAHADAGCPDNIGGAVADEQWAAERFATIADEKVTTGLFYDDDGMLHRLESGKDTASSRANELLRDLGRLPPGYTGDGA